MTPEYPALIISDNLVSLYKKFNESGLIVNIVTSVSELRSFLSKYARVITSTPIIISDIARFGNYQSRLLKFVEEAISPLIMISSEDCIQSVLLSRFMTIVKYPKIIENETDKPSLLHDLFSRGEEKVSISEIIKYAPSVFQVSELVRKSDLPSKDKIQQLIFS